MKIVINTCHGGFNLSDAALDLYNALSGNNVIYACDIDRNDPHLVNIVELLREKAGGRHSDLRVVDIPEGVEWQVEEYDGKEWIAEKHRTWGLDD